MSDGLTDSQFLLNLAERLEEYLLGICDIERLEEIANRIEVKRFILHWFDGKKETVTGHDIADACRRAGIGAGATRALDYWELTCSD